MIDVVQSGLERLACVMHTTAVLGNADATAIDKHSPTARAYGELSAAQKYFNHELFHGELPHCLITLQRRSHRTYGYFSGARFGSNRDLGKVTDEIAMNPLHFKYRAPADVLGTLAHEMCHHWQAHFGKPSRGGYHNKEWARKMLAIGLHPSHTGNPGGKMLGQQMTHYIIPESPVAQAIEFLIGNGWSVSWYDRLADGQALGGVRGGPDALIKAPKSGSRIKYSCPTCDLNAWAKPRANLVCGNCRSLMAASDRGIFRNSS